jgi:biopolymer transport protein ExbD
MRIRHAIHEQEEGYNLVPLTDMVFNLLIFFMCATTFAQVEKELSVQLPRTTASFKPLSAAPPQVIINVKEDGATVVSGRTYDVKGLSEFLAGALKREPGTSVVVRADERTLMKYFASVASVCRHAGVHETRLSYVDDGRAAAIK